MKRKLRMMARSSMANQPRQQRSHGNKFQVSIKQETSRLLKSNYKAAEVVYKKAQMIDPDANKACNLALCLLKLGRHDEARQVVEDVLRGRLPSSDDPKPRSCFLKSSHRHGHRSSSQISSAVKGIQRLLDEWARPRSKRLPVFKEISSFRDQLHSTMR